MDQFYAYCLQGNIPKAMDYLNNLEPLTEEILQLRQDYKNRFFEEDFKETIKVEDSWIQEIIRIYYRYFRTVLTNFEALSQAEEQLKKDLANQINKKENAKMDEIEDELALIFKQKGYHFLGGVTEPFSGPYIWKVTDSEKVEVELPHVTQRMNVHYMKEFLLKSWMSFATFNQRNVGGWVKEDGLYCNVAAYPDLNGPAFQVTFLKHEAQHFHDQQVFPDLESKELEYRAKLVELIYAKDHSTILKLRREASDTPEFPHPYASFLIMNDLTKHFFASQSEVSEEEWAALSAAEIAKVALIVFDLHTEKLMSKE